MKPRLIITFLLIVFVPLAILVWLGVKVARDDREMTRHRFQELLVSRLGDIDADIAEVLAKHERALLMSNGLSALPVEVLRQRAWDSGIVNQFFLVDSKGDLLYPSALSAPTEAETAFLERTASIWENHQIPPPTDENAVSSSTSSAPPPQQVSQQAPMAQQADKGNIGLQISMEGKYLSKGRASQARPVSREKGWYAWYWGNGINLIFWWRDDHGQVVGAELNHVRLLADIVGMLPDTDPAAPTLPDGRIALVDSKGGIIYQWGAYVPAENEQARATLPLRPPLGSWRLDYYAPAELAGASLGRGLLFNLASGLVVLTLAVVALAVYFYRESSREMREAAQRVTFVNQVSHELKTPLTNIRMYAEMLEEQLDQEDPKAQRRLGVIVSESQRLSRLIGNVLTFSRSQRKTLKLRPAPAIADEVLHNILQRFEPPLSAQGIGIEAHYGAPVEAQFDRDVLEQILGNLLNNVEKYASSGKRVEVASRQDATSIHVIVADDGPGIPSAEREQIFRPFYRVSDKLTDGVAGTGIGLAIARELARRHGGDLILEHADRGARFHLILRAPWTQTGDKT